MALGDPSLPPTPASAMGIHGVPRAAQPTGSQRPCAAREPSWPTEEETEGPRAFLPKATG